MDILPSIRLATEHDAELLLAIYAPYVTNTAITFEYTVPTIDEFRSRITQTLTRYPYLVMHQQDEILGYAYASAFKPRTAYNYAVETTIYLNQSVRGKGIGRQLYNSLEACLAAQGVINLNACITPESLPYTSAISEQFHTKLGYKKVAHFTNCGYKFERWFDVIWMEKFIQEHTQHPAPFKPFSTLSDQRIQKILNKL